MAYAFYYNPEEISKNPFVCWDGRFYFLNNRQDPKNFVELKDRKFGLSPSGYQNEFEQLERTANDDYLVFKNSILKSTKANVMSQRDKMSKLRGYRILEFLIKEVMPLMTDFNAKGELEEILTGKKSMDKIDPNKIFQSMLRPSYKTENAEEKTKLIQYLHREIKRAHVIPPRFLVFGDYYYEISKEDRSSRIENSKLVFNGTPHYLTNIGPITQLVKAYQNELRNKLVQEIITELKSKAKHTTAEFLVKESVQTKLKEGLEFGDFGILFNEKRNIYYAYLKVHPFALWNGVMIDRIKGNGNELDPKYEFSTYSKCRVTVDVDYSVDRDKMVCNLEEGNPPRVIEEYNHPFLGDDNDEPLQELCMGDGWKTPDSELPVTIATALSAARNILYHGYHEESNPYRLPGEDDSGDIDLIKQCCNLRKIKRLGLPVTNISDAKAKEFGVRNRVGGGKK